MKFTAVVVAHDASPQKIVRNLQTQTRPPDEIIVFLSADKQALELTSLCNGDLRVVIVANRNDWGHKKRSLGLQLAKGDVVGWFNHDDEYDSRYVELLLGGIEAGADVAYCRWSEGANRDVGNTEFRSGSSTAGNWIARTELVRRAGYLGRHYSADGELIDSVAALGPRIVRVESQTILYSHNP